MTRNFLPEHRRWIGEALCKTIRLAKLQCLAISVGSSHSHLLIECENDLASVKKVVRRLKRVSSRLVREKLPGRIWAQAGKPIRITDRAHQQKVFEYVLDHAKKEDAWIWRFDQAENEKERKETGLELPIRN